MGRPQLIDLLFLACNRREFTQASLQALRVNTDWGKVGRAYLYDDNSTDGTPQCLLEPDLPVETRVISGVFGSPVSVMNHYLSALDATNNEIFAKIDNDTMVPPGWLGAALQVMDAHRNLDLLGIEAHRSLGVEANGVARAFEPASFIGGIGLMRQGSFITLPRPSGRFGFTAWQEKSPWVTKGWLKPALPVFLLDRLPREPWQSLSAEYVAKGWQRPWGQYEEKDRDLWSWWCP